MGLLFTNGRTIPSHGARRRQAESCPGSAAAARVIDWTLVWRACSHKRRGSCGGWWDCGGLGAGFLRNSNRYKEQLTTYSWINIETYTNRSLGTSVFSLREQTHWLHPFFVRYHAHDVNKTDPQNSKRGPGNRLAPLLATSVKGKIRATRLAGI